MRWSTASAIPHCNYSEVSEQIRNTLAFGQGIFARVLDGESDLYYDFTMKEDEREMIGMNIDRICKELGRLLLSAVLAGLLTVMVDCAVVAFEAEMSILWFAALFLLLLLAIRIILQRSWKINRVAMIMIPLILVLSIVAGMVCWKSVSKASVYSDVDSGKELLYGGKRVMLIVPHQDDDMNLLGGVAEEYVKYGSDLYVVFATNGDYHGLAEVRIGEALEVLGRIGIPEDHVIFLGYGDGWDSEGPHLYSSEPGVVRTSVYGSTQTYGTAQKAAYREGRAYTIENFLEDIESVILEYRPDTIYCVDYDLHIDHRALSHSFEKVMGKILKEQKDYRPAVFKGYAYYAAWEAENDFYEENILSTQNVFGEPHHQQPEIYRWEERVRLPVSAGGLSRSLYSSEIYKVFTLYASQETALHGINVVNGDKVFWERETMSLCYDADIQCSSGNGWLLNDFMLLEEDNLPMEFDTLVDGAWIRIPVDGTWIPAPEDSEKTVCITFAEPRDIGRIVLYDNPDVNSNIHNARITFDDGKFLETGPLDPAGAASEFSVKKENVTSFTVTLVEADVGAGLTEIEAYADFRDGLPYVKIMDTAENFVYDYLIDSSGSQEFLLYTGRSAGNPEEAGYILTCSNPECSANWVDGKIVAECPTGETAVITVSDSSGTISDTVTISNPGSLERIWQKLWLNAEKAVFNIRVDKTNRERMVVCRVFSRVWSLIAG